MAIYFALLFVLIIFGMKFSPFHSDYLEQEQTTAVKGIFAIVIFLSHTKNYVALSNGIGDRLFDIIIYAIGQTMVAVFFFYSGYGVAESYRQKPLYDKQFFKNRILKTLVHFDLAVVLYMILNLIIGRRIPVKRFLLSLVGWVSIGNSSWFICVLLILYLLTLLAFILNRKAKNVRHVTYTVTALCLLTWGVMFAFGRPECWYNTLLCYSAGMFFSAFRNKIDEHMSKTGFYYGVTALLAGIIMFCWMNKGGPLIYSLFTLTVSILIVVFTMKVKIKNKYLTIFGQYSFSMFILQRLPMTILLKLKINSPIIFTALAFIATCVLALVFERLLCIVDRHLLKVH